MTCIKMGSDESHFNVSLIVRDKVTRQCPQTTTFELKAEPKRYRTEVLLHTSLQPTSVVLGIYSHPLSLTSCCLGPRQQYLFGYNSELNKFNQPNQTLPSVCPASALLVVAADSLFLLLHTVTVLANRFNQPTATLPYLFPTSSCRRDGRGRGRL